MSQQIQSDLFGSSSYKSIRKPVKGQKSGAGQMALFPIISAVKAAVLILKKGQRYIVEKTKMTVTFIKRSGQTTIWSCDGHLYRVSEEILKSANLREVTA